MKVLIIAFGFFLILEGITPLLFPEKWKDLIQTICRIPTQKIRNCALVSVVLGLLFVWAAMSL